MILNFIQDEGKVHVETQNQIAHQQELFLKLKLLREDCNDFRSLNPEMRDMNRTFSKIVKELYQYVTDLKNKQKDAQSQKKHKKIPLPYNILKKMQTLRHKLIVATKIVHQQNLSSRLSLMNTQNHKKQQVKFYKAVLGSYEEKRKQFKKDTLQLENMVQKVENQIQHLSYNQNHSFTDYESRMIPFEQLPNVEKKLNKFKKVIQEIRELKIVKKRVSDIQKDQVQSCKQSQKQSKHYFHGNSLIRSYIEIKNKIQALRMNRLEVVSRLYQTLQTKNKKERVIIEKIKASLSAGQDTKYYLQLHDKISKAFFTQNKKIKMSKTDKILYWRELKDGLDRHFDKMNITFQLSLTKKLRSKSI